ncbi:MAG: hypothetical protein J6N72_05970 [Psychrobacter sp.]|nr:hypothetical protein [Psychrobacter sp.]
MSKYKTTQKDAKNSNTVVIAVPYCFLQHVLNYEQAVAYNAGNDGWNFDLYEIDSRYNITTGYRSMERASTHNLNDYADMRADLKQLDDSCVGRDIGRDERKERLVAILEKHLPA